MPSSMQRRTDSSSRPPVTALRAGTITKSEILWIAGHIVPRSDRDLNNLGLDVPGADDTLKPFELARRTRLGSRDV